MKKKFLMPMSGKSRKQNYGEEEEAAPQIYGWFCEIMILEISQRSRKKASSAHTRGHALPCRWSHRSEKRSDDGLYSGF